MSAHSVPAFDMLTGQKSPYVGFGPPAADLQGRMETFQSMANIARLRMEKMFGSNLDDRRHAPKIIDDIISEMWKNGWNPSGNNINLFVTDFGAVVTDTLLETFGGKVIFRSDADISHLSIWWPDLELELFPFHFLLKALLDPQANTVQSLIKGVASYAKKHYDGDSTLPLDPCSKRSLDTDIS